MGEKLSTFEEGGAGRGWTGSGDAASAAATANARQSDAYRAAKAARADALKTTTAAGGVDVTRASGCASSSWDDDDDDDDESPTLSNLLSNGGVSHRRRRSTRTGGATTSSNRRRHSDGLSHRDRQLLRGRRSVGSEPFAATKTTADFSPEVESIHRRRRSYPQVGAEVRGGVGEAVNNGTTNGGRHARRASESSEYSPADGYEDVAVEAEAEAEVGAEVEVEEDDDAGGGEGTGGVGVVDYESLSFFELAKLGYQEIINAIIRPPRAQYSLADLGPSRFTYCDRVFVRTDIEIPNQRGMVLQCSHWEPELASRPYPQLPCVIYLHGNSSARVEALPQLALCLSLGITLFAFDTAGSGLSDGEWVSLGYFERDDLQSVVTHLRESGGVSSIGLWGRSMGAATALLHGDRDPYIAAMVLDSPFADLTQLAEEIVEKGRGDGISIPSFVLRALLSIVKSSVKTQAGFDLDLCSPISNVGRCYIPALFACAQEDRFILPHHSYQMFAKYAGEKQLLEMEGDHNSHRPRDLYLSAGAFLQDCLQVPPEYMLEGSAAASSGLPPWRYGHIHANNYLKQWISKRKSVICRMWPDEGR